MSNLADRIDGMTGEDWQAGGALPDILSDLKREGHICDRLYVAGSRLVLDMTRVHGSSAGLTGRYGDQVDGCAGERLPPRYASDIDAFARMDAVLSELRPHERRLLESCVLARDKPRGTLADWGRQHSAYKTAKTARALTVGSIRALLESLCELYLYRDKISRPG